MVYYIIQRERRIQSRCRKAGPVLRIAQKSELFLDKYRREDGSKWSGQDLAGATGGVVTRSYVSTLRKGRIENPGFEKLRAIAKAMNFPPELWFEDVENLPKAAGPLRGEERRRLRRELHYSLGPQLSNQALTIGPTDVSAYANSVATRYRKPRTGLSSEEENRIYSMMRLQALAQRDGLLIAS